MLFYSYILLWFSTKVCFFVCLDMIGCLHCFNNVRVIRLFNILKLSGNELSEGPKYVAIAGERSSVVGWWLFLTLYFFFWVCLMRFYWTLTNPCAKVEIWDVNTAERIVELSHSSDNLSNQSPNQRGLFVFSFCFVVRLTLTDRLLLRRLLNFRIFMRIIYCISIMWYLWMLVQQSV